MPSLQRRTSKRASSNDRHGHVYLDSFPESTIRSITPDTPGYGEPPASPSVNGYYPGDAPLSAEKVQGPSSPRELNTRDRAGRGQYASDAPLDSASRPRTRTLDGRLRDLSPPAKITKSRNRLASMNALPTVNAKEANDLVSSVGHPSIVPGQSRHRLVKPPPRPLTPMVNIPQSAVPSLPSPLPDPSRILQLMKTTCGRMHGILWFRTTRSGPWSSGYCAINVASGSLIYQMKGDVSHAKTLIPDLRGCKVRTQMDNESRSSFLEISTRTSGLGIHLRPHVPETFDSWLAALLCWQPLRPKGAQNKMTRHQAPIATERRVGDRRRNSVINLTKDAAIIKVSKMLCWDHEARITTPISPTRRISTYKQQRSASGTPWRKVSCTLQEDGQLKLYAESDTSLCHAVPLSLLSRHAIQRLHSTALDDEFSIGIYPQYTTSNVPLDLRHPIFLSLENRILFEAWFVLMRAFTIPELYGPEQISLRTSVDLVSPNEDAQATNTENMFRMESLLLLRVIEAKVHAPRELTKTNSPRATRAGSSHGKDPVVSDYHTEVVLDGEVRGRTTIKTATHIPFWREDYEFSDLPPVLTSAMVLLKSRNSSQRDWTLISDGRYDYENGDVDNLGRVGDVQVSPLDVTVGFVDLRLDDLPRGKDDERWWPIINEHDESVGELLMKVRIDEAVVLMSQDYKPLSELLHSFSNGLTQQIASACPAEVARKLSETFLNIFQVSAQAGKWITSLVEDEIDGLHRDTPATRFRYSRRIASNDSYDSGIEREIFLRDQGKNATAEANLLFRGNSLLTKALEFHMRRLGKEYLEDTLGERIRDIDESDPECEVDPNRVQNPVDLERNWRNLIALTENVWRAIAASHHRCPSEIRMIFRHIRSCAEDRYGDFLRSVKYSSVSGFLFLRFFCPAVLNPKLFGLLKGN